MATHLLRLCVPCAILCVSLSGAKPVAEESSLQGHHRFTHRNAFVSQHPDSWDNYATKLDSEGLPSSGQLLASRTTTKEDFNSGDLTEFERFNTPTPLQHFRKNLKRIRKLVPRGEQTPNLRSQLAPDSNDETGSVSSGIFVSPESTGQEASAPYPPVVSQVTGPVQENLEGPPSYASTETLGSAPSTTYAKRRTGESEVGSPSLSSGDQEASPELENSLSPDAKTSMSEDSYALSAAPVFPQPTGGADLLRTNSLSFPDSNSDFEEPLNSRRPLSSASGRVPDEMEVVTGLNDDDHQISVKFQDDSLPNPFPPNPDFFAFSPPPVDALGRLTGRPFSFGTGFNQEGTSIGDAAYIVPDDLAKDLDFELPKSEPPRETFGLTVDDGNSVRNELRKDTGEYIESLTTVDGTSRSESAVLVPTKDGGRVLVIKGFYSYRSPDGLTVRVDYTSDQNGYRAKPTTMGTRKPATSGPHKPAISGLRKPKPTS